MLTKINPAWIAYNDLQNEGGEGYNPHPKYIAASTPVATARKSVSVRMLKDERGNLIPADKMAARLARDESRISKTTDASALQIVQASIDYARAQLAA